MNWLESLANAIGNKVALELKQPQVFGDLVRRMYDRNGNTIYVTSEGKQMLPVTTGFSGFHWCLSSEMQRGSFVGMFEYDINMQFVAIGPSTTPDTDAWRIAEAISGGYNNISSQIGSATATPSTLTYDLPTVLGSHFPHLQQQILAGQLNLFAVEVGYRIKMARR